MPFDQCEPYLRPLMHTVCLVWANSDYYNTPTRIIVLMQEICNLIIEMVSTRSLGVSALFMMYVVLRQGDRVCGGGGVYVWHGCVCEVCMCEFVVSARARVCVCVVCLNLWCVCVYVCVWCV